MKQRMDRAGQFFFRTGAGRSVLAVVLLTLFLVGYSTASSVVGRCAAAATNLLGPYGDKIPLAIKQSPDTLLEPPVTTWPVCQCIYGPTVIISLCDFIGEAELVTELISENLESTLEETATSLEAFIGNWLVDGMMTAMLETLNQAELNLIDWWDTFWFYNLYPGLQDMTKQPRFGSVPILANESRV